MKGCCGLIGVMIADFLALRDQAVTHMHCVTTSVGLYKGSGTISGRYYMDKNEHKGLRIKESKFTMVENELY